jgi:23S rRNA (adenine2503-C2)-methyltransferase
MENKQDLKGLSLAELESFCASIGEPSFRAVQLMKWIHRKQLTSFSEMTDLGMALREKLGRMAFITGLSLLDVSTSPSKDTVKFLFGLKDGHMIESVLMRYVSNLGPGRVSVCISSQVGCAMGCIFCASGAGGLARNLSAAEIADQVLRIQAYLAPDEERVANVVVMGIGEPLANYDNTLRAIRLLNDSKGLAIGMRHISLSTCGLPEQILRLAGEGLSLRLAVSLHAHEDGLRSRLMPVNRQAPIGRLLSACRKYQELTGRRITFEYALIRGLNDSREDAGKLARLLHGLNSHVNLIPLNRSLSTGLEPTLPSEAEAFRREVENSGIKATLRQERGGDISAACGQLRRHMMEESEIQSHPRLKEL